MIYIVARTREAAVEYAMRNGVSIFAYAETPWMLAWATSEPVFVKGWHLGRPQEEVWAFLAERTIKQNEHSTPEFLRSQNLSVPWAVPRGRDSGETAGTGGDEPTGRAGVPSGHRAEGQGPVVPRGKTEVRKVWDRVKRAWEALR